IAGGFRNPPRVPVLMQGGLGPTRPHKPVSGRFDSDPCNWGCDLPPTLLLARWLASELARRGHVLQSSRRDAKRAGRPRIARLQVGGRLVGRPPRDALQALVATHPARTRERTVRFGRGAPFRGSSVGRTPAC